MQEQTVTVALKNGLDAGAIAALVQKACHYECKVYLQTEGKKINAKSIMGMMNAGVPAGGEVSILTDGEDEAAAQAEISGYISETKTSGL